MIWWGYAGFTGAVSLCVALLAAIVGLSGEIVLNLAGVTAGGLVAFGVTVHLFVLMLRATARSAKRAVVAPRVEPAFLRPQASSAVASAQSAPSGLLKPIGKPARGPGALEVLFPQQAVH
jgi:hypothetical protein